MDDPGSGKRSRSRARRRRSPPAVASPSYPTLLLSVAGLSPQVITETLYCLLVQRRPPVNVREIHVLTTRIGREQVCERLLHPRDGWFHRFCRDYRMPAGRIRFGAETIHVPAGGAGRPLEDVRALEDNARVADAVLALVRDFTRDPAVALHGSVAGGRKTMGLFLGIAFQLFARPQDRLSHVLVSPPDLEGHPEFYYPPPAPTSYQTKTGRVRSLDARVELAEIPILLLRDKVSAVNLEEPSYSALIKMAQLDVDRQAAPPALVLHDSSRSLRVAESPIPLAALEFAIYRVFAERRRACSQRTCSGCPSCGLGAKAFLDESVMVVLRNTCVALGIRDERARALSGWGVDAPKRFRETQSRINRKIRDALGPGQWARRYLITPAGRHGETIYYLPAEPELIRFA